MTIIEKLHFYHRVFRYRFHTEKTQLKNLLNLNLKSTTTIDIGANRGIYSYWLAKSVTSNGQVIAFEPQKEMCKEIKKYCKWHKFKHVTVINQGISNVEANLSLFIEEIGDGSATFEESLKNNQQNQKLKIQVVTLDTYVMLHDLKKISFIKIDVEGHENKVIEGAQKTLMKFKPFVQVEIADTHSDATHSLIKMFIELGYAGKVLLDGGEMPDIKFLQLTPSPKFGFTGHRDLFFYYKY